MKMRFADALIASITTNLPARRGFGVYCIIFGIERKSYKNPLTAEIYQKFKQTFALKIPSSEQKSYIPSYFSTVLITEFRPTP